MKAKSLYVTNSDGQRQSGWMMRRFTNAWNCGGNIPSGKGKLISGWTLIDPDGYERNKEGDWLDFVEYAKMVVGNHGLCITIS